MPLKKLESLESELKSIDAEYVNVSVNPEHAKELKEMKKEGISLEDIKE